MSVDALSWVWKHSQSEGVHRLVLLAIADYANHDGRAWPSTTSIANKAKVGRRSVFRAVDRLVEMGELERVTGGGVKGHGGTTNGYRMTFRTDPKWCQGGTSATESLVPSRHEVVSPWHSSGVTMAPEPSVTVREPSSARKRPETFAPDELVITPEMRAWAEGIGIGSGLDDETATFLDWHRSKQNKYRDWTAAWRTWMRKAVKRDPKKFAGRSFDEIDDFANEVYR